MKNAEAINRLAAEVHVANEKWRRSLETGEPIQRNVGELLCLVHSEISEAMEGHRKRWHTMLCVLTTESPASQRKEILNDHHDATEPLRSE